MDILFWLDTVPVCCKGIFDQVAEQWNGKVYYICNKNLSAEREKITSDNSYSENNEHAQIIYTSQHKDRDKFVNELLKKHISDIHVFNGYKSSTAVYLDRLIQMNKAAKTVVWAERPSPEWKAIFPFSLYHTYYALRYRNHVTALLPLGQKGVMQYRRYGWQKDKIFPFLYLPVMNESIPRQSIHDTPKDVRFVYLGRFSMRYKGTDVLMEAIKHLKHSNYSLEMVGGYGDLKEKTMAWIEQESKVSFGGAWPIEEACDRLSKYDVCIVPSKYEGWNVTLNEALMAGIGCIATEGAVSDEMVTVSGAGMVVRAKDAKALAEAMDTVMENPSLIADWKQKAYVYRPNMTARVCADYFIKVMKYLFEKDEVIERPVAPWQKE